MSNSRARAAGTNRVQRHRRRLERSGKARVEVTVPTADARLMRALADRLRAGGETAVEIRAALAPLVAGTRARNGKELLAFFRASPLVGKELRVERDRSPGREPTL